MGMLVVNSSKIAVLIDTWWNVNMYLKKELRLNAGVLIDTWWNVNKFKNMYRIRQDYGFNRYMVECE